MTLNIPKSLLESDIHGFSDEANARKRQFHVDGVRFMRELAAALGITGACSIHNNPAGDGVSGEITLHGDHIYVQLSGDSNDGPELLFRSCTSRKDYTGGGNNFIRMRHLATYEAEQERFVERCQELIARAVAHA